MSVETVTAVCIGILGGVVGAAPFLVSRRRMKARMKTDGMGGIATGMAATLISFLIMIAEIIICMLLAREYLLPFSISAITVFLLAMLVYTATLFRR